MPLSLERPPSRRADPSANPFPGSGAGSAPERHEQISPNPIDPNRLQPLLPPAPCPHNRRRSDHRHAAPESTAVSLHLAWTTVKHNVFYVLGNP